MQLTGIHHLTAVTADAPGQPRLLHRHARPAAGEEDRQPGRRVAPTTCSTPTAIGIAGHRHHLLRLAGRRASGAARTASSAPGLRVAGADALALVASAGSRPGRDARRASSSATAGSTLDFEDPEGQRLSLVDDGGAGAAHPWAQSPVPAEHQIRGLGPITHQRARPGADRARADARAGDDARSASTPTPGDGGSRTPRLRDGRRAGRRPSCTSRSSRTLPAAQPGAGGVHHVAFRIPDADYEAWDERLQQRARPLQRPRRPLLLPQPLLPRAERHPVRDRHRRARLRGRRADGNASARSSSLPPFLEGRRRGDRGGT